MSDTRGYERGEDKLREAVSQILIEKFPPEQARELSIAIQRKSQDLSGDGQPASACRRLRERVFQLIGESESQIVSTGDVARGGV